MNTFFSLLNALLAYHPMKIVFDLQIVESWLKLIWSWRGTFSLSSKKLISRTSEKTAFVPWWSCHFHRPLPLLEYSSPRYHRREGIFWLVLHVGICRLRCWGLGFVAFFFVSRHVWVDLLWGRCISGFLFLDMIWGLVYFEIDFGSLVSTISMMFGSYWEFWDGFSKKIWNFSHGRFLEKIVIISWAVEWGSS